MSAKIFAAMVKAQKAYGPALKRSLNPHFGKKYADLAACIEAVIDALNENGIAMTQMCHESPDGVVVETVLVHESGEQWSGGKLFVPAEKKDPQKFGSALTYARRYSLSATCGIAPEDDDGNAASEPPKKPAAPAPPTPKASTGPKTIVPKDFQVFLEGSKDLAVLEAMKRDALFELRVKASGEDGPSVLRLLDARIAELTPATPAAAQAVQAAFPGAEVAGTRPEFANGKSSGMDDMPFPFD